jgi:type VII secretion protein eccCb
MTQMDIAVARMRGRGIPAHQVWLPPLDVPDTLDQLFGDLVADPELGLISPSWRARGPLRIPLGTVDLPLEQRRDVLEFDFSGANGHFAVIGGPLTGKSTTLRSVVMALSLVHTPQEVQFYVIDLGGGGFTAFNGAAHVAGVATRDRPDVVNRMLSEIEGIIDDREKYFRGKRIDSMDTYRQGRAEGRFDDGYGDVFLVVDGWAVMKTDLNDVDTRILAIMTRALSFGVHVLLSTNRWADIRQQVADAIGSRLELKLGDVMDTRLDRKVAKAVPPERPGRGQEIGHHHVLVCLPRIDGEQDPSSLGKGVGTSLERIAQAAPAPGPKLRLLPIHVTAEKMLQHPGAAEGLVLGVEESRLGPFMFHPRQDSHLFLLGDAKSGKTTFLRSFVQEIMRNFSSQQAQIFVVDYRRSLLDQVPAEYLAAYMTNPEETEGVLGHLAEFLRARMPSDSVTSDQLRNRSWWTGAEAWVLVDDYDLVAIQGNNPLTVLQPLMAQAQDLGLHILVARRMGGASRALYEPVLQSMRDLGTTGILLSGSPEEGSIIGRVKPVKSLPGRAQVISRDDGYFRAQLVWADQR